jgi:hypothetical protein
LTQFNGFTPIIVPKIKIFENKQKKNGKGQLFDNSEAGIAAPKL